MSIKSFRTLDPLSAFQEGLGTRLASYSGVRGLGMRLASYSGVRGLGMRLASYSGVRGLGMRLGEIGPGKREHYSIQHTSCFQKQRGVSLGSKTRVAPGNSDGSGQECIRTGDWDFSLFPDAIGGFSSKWILVPFLSGT